MTRKTQVSETESESSRGRLKSEAGFGFGLRFEPIVAQGPLKRADRGFGDQKLEHLDAGADLGQAPLCRNRVASSRAILKPNVIGTACCRFDRPAIGV